MYLCIIQLPSIYTYICNVNIIFKNRYSKNLKVILTIQWIFVILLNLFVIRYFKGACASDETLKGYMVRERLGTPDRAACDEPCKEISNNKKTI